MAEPIPFASQTVWLYTAGPPPAWRSVSIGFDALRNPSTILVWADGPVPVAVYVDAAAMGRALLDLFGDHPQ